MIESEGPAVWLDYCKVSHLPSYNIVEFFPSFSNSAMQASIYCCYPSKLVFKLHFNVCLVCLVDAFFCCLLLRSKGFSKYVKLYSVNLQLICIVMTKLYLQRLKAAGGRIEVDNIWGQMSEERCFLY